MSGVLGRRPSTVRVDRLRRIHESQLVWAERYREHPRRIGGWARMPVPLQDILISAWKESLAPKSGDVRDLDRELVGWEDFICEWGYDEPSTSLGYDYEPTPETDAAVGSVVKLYGHDVEVTEVDDEWTNDEDTGKPRLFRSITVRSVQG